jgi:CheY-like chemotaxis protein
MEKNESDVAPAVLIVDDEQRVREVLSEYLKKAGYFVLEARDVREAVQVVEEHLDLKLIITDIHMPGESGLVLVERARLNRPDLRFIVMSAALPGDEPALRCLKKPFRLADLRAAVREELAAPGGP